MPSQFIAKLAAGTYVHILRTDMMKGQLIYIWDIKKKIQKLKYIASLNIIYLLSTRSPVHTAYTTINLYSKKHVGPELGFEFLLLPGLLSSATTFSSTRSTCGIAFTTISSSAPWALSCFWRWTHLMERRTYEPSRITFYSN